MCLADCGGLARSENEMETVTVRMARGERNIPWGFGVSEGSKGQAIIVNIVGGSLAERAGLRNGDEIEGIEGLNNLDINAVDRLLITSRDRIELIVHRHSSAVASANQMSRLQHQHQHQHQQQQQQDTRMWRPDIQESGDGQRPFKVSLEHNNDSRAPEGFNSSALPFQADPRVKHLQYNSPMGLYSNANVAESYNQQTTGYVEASAAPTYSHDQPSYLRSETLRLLKEQEAQRATPTLSQHPNPAGLPLCFVCNRKILGLLARAAGHDLHADCFQCATCGNSLKNVGHHFVESKFYCDIHGRQKKSLINGAASHPIIQSPPSKGHSNHSQEHVGSFYQPEILSRPIATQSINTHQINVNVQNPKTQGPISPAQRGIPTNSIFTGDQTTTTTKSAASSAEHFRNGNQSSSYNFNATHNAPSLPVQAPPPLPSQNTPASSYQSNNEIYTKSITKASNPSPKTLNGNLSQQQTGGRTAFCESCKQQIRGAFVLASGLSWCPEHFICANSRCGRRLLECGFVEEGGQKYCEGCFETFIAPRCSKCTKPIISDCLNALQKKWHPTCFTCTHCQKPFGNSAFYLENGQAFCEGDWNMLFTTKCVNCKFAIEAGDRWVEALGSAFHSNCFNCSRCMINLEGESFFAKNGEPFCKLHA